MKAQSETRSIVAFLPLVAVLGFANEYSQSSWGVRSAKELSTLYNSGPVSGVPLSWFDCAFWIAALVALRSHQVRVVCKRLRLRPVAVAGLALLVPVIVTTGRAMIDPPAVDLYHVARELRPLLYAPVALLIGVSLRSRSERVWILLMSVGVARGVQGALIHLAGGGRYYYGSRMAFYDYSDSLLLVFCLFLLLDWRPRVTHLNGRLMLLKMIVATPMVYTLVFSYRRSIWLGALVALVLSGALGYRGSGRLAAGTRRSVILITVLLVALLSSETDLLISRLVSVTDFANDPSNSFRVHDLANGLEAARQAALMPYGFGSRFPIVSSEPYLYEFIYHVSRTNHNSYLYLVLKLGLPGAIIWLSIIARVTRLAFRSSATRLANDGGIRAVAGLAVTAAVAAVALPIAYNVRPTAMLFLLLGIASGELASNSSVRLPRQSLGEPAWSAR